MFYDLYCQLCAQKSEKPSRAATNMGINRSTVSQWKAKYDTGVDITPNIEVLKKIADYFGVTVDYLLEKEQKEKAPAEAEADPLSQVSFALFGEHDVLDEDLLNDVRSYAKFKLEQKRHAEEKNK